MFARSSLRPRAARLLPPGAGWFGPLEPCCALLGCEGTRAIKQPRHKADAWRFLAALETHPRLYYDICCHHTMPASRMVNAAAVLVVLLLAASPAAGSHTLQVEWRAAAVWQLLVVVPVASRPAPSNAPAAPQAYAGQTPPECSGTFTEEWSHDHIECHLGICNGGWVGGREEGGPALAAVATLPRMPSTQAPPSSSASCTAASSGARRQQVHSDVGAFSRSSLQST